MCKQRWIFKKSAYWKLARKHVGNLLDIWLKRRWMYTEPEGHVQKDKGQHCVEKSSPLLHFNGPTQLLVGYLINVNGVFPLLTWQPLQRWINCCLGKLSHGTVQYMTISQTQPFIFFTARLNTSELLTWDEQTKMSPDKIVQLNSLRVHMLDFFLSFILSSLSSAPPDEKNCSAVFSTLAQKKRSHYCVVITTL